MYLFLLRPRWLLGFVGCVALAALCVLAGFWQFDRLDQRRAANARVLHGRGAVPVDATELLTADHALPISDEYRPVRATGHYEPAGELLVRGRSLERQAGVFVLTPLVTAGGERVLVVRGWAALSDQGANVAPEVPAAPTGDVTVLGRARRAEPPSGTVSPIGRVRSVQRIAPSTVRPATGPVLDGYVELTDPVQKGLVPVPEPEVGEGPHLAYGVQWFLFAVLSFVGYGIFARREADTRRDVAVIIAEPEPEPAL